MAVVAGRLPQRELRFVRAAKAPSPCAVGAKSAAAPLASPRAGR